MTSLFPRASDKVPAWVFNGQFGKNFAATFDLQMWCLGCDIRRKAGNLLLEYGFSRTRPTGKITGSSYYFKELDAVHTIHLWGFAVLITTKECGLCLRRHERIPLFSHKAEVNQNTWRPQDIPKFKEPREKQEKEKATELLKMCVSELRKYEATIQDLEEPQYRSSCLRGRKKIKALRKTTLLEAWTELDSAIGETKNANI
jgi:hypothetical protein